MSGILGQIVSRSNKFNNLGDSIHILTLYSLQLWVPKGPLRMVPINTQR